MLAIILSSRIVFGLARTLQLEHKIKMKVFLKIILVFPSFIILTSLIMPVYAVEDIVTDHKGGSKKVLEYTDYNALKDAELIRMVQLVLKESRFDPGPIDGVLGPKTRAAIKSFQIKNDFEPTGELDKQTIDRLFWSF